MATKKYITLNEFADFHRISVTLLKEFGDFGLLRIQQIENDPCILYDEIEQVERAVRLYRDLGVNKEGIEIILEMRKREEELRQEITRLRHLLKKYESRISEFFPEDFFDAE